MDLFHSTNSSVSFSRQKKFNNFFFHYKWNPRSPSGDIKKKIIFTFSWILKYENVFLRYANMKKSRLIFFFFSFHETISVDSFDFLSKKFLKLDCNRIVVKLVLLYIYRCYFLCLSVSVFIYHHKYSNFNMLDKMIEIVVDLCKIIFFALRWCVHIFLIAEVKGRMRVGLTKLKYLQKFYNS